MTTHPDLNFRDEVDSLGPKLNVKQWQRLTTCLVQKVNQAKWEARNEKKFIEHLQPDEKDLNEIVAAINQLIDDRKR